MKSKIEEMKNAVMEKKIGEEIKKILSKLCIKYKVNKGDAFLVEQEVEGEELLHLCIMKSDKARLSVDNSIEELLGSKFIDIASTIKGDFERFKIAIDIQGQRNEEILKDESTAIRESIIYTNNKKSINVKILKGNQIELAKMTFEKIKEIELNKEKVNKPNIRNKINK